MKRVMNDTPRPVNEQSQMTGFKRKDFVPLLERASYPKKGKSSKSFGQLQNRGGSFVHEGSSGGSRCADTRGYIRGQARQ